MAKLQILSYRISAKVKIAVFHAQIIASIRIVFNRKRRRLSGIQHYQLCYLNLNITRRQLSILRIPFAYDARSLNHIFAAKFIGDIKHFFVYALVKSELRDAVAVAEVHKRHATHLANALYPTRKGDFFVLIGESQFAACDCTIHIFVIKLCVFPPATHMIASAYFRKKKTFFLKQLAKLVYFFQIYKRERYFSIIFQ